MRNQMLVVLVLVFVALGACGYAVYNYAWMPREEVRLNYERAVTERNRQEAVLEGDRLTLLKYTRESKNYLNYLKVWSTNAEGKYSSGSFQTAVDATVTPLGVTILNRTSHEGHMTIDQYQYAGTTYTFSGVTDFKGLLTAWGTLEGNLDLVQLTAADIAPNPQASPGSELSFQLSFFVPQFALGIVNPDGVPSEGTTTLDVTLPGILPPMAAEAKPARGAKGKK
jgi:hypothetical protein